MEQSLTILPTPVEFSKLQQDNQAETNRVVLLQAHDEMLNGKKSFFIHARTYKSFSPSKQLKGDLIVAKNYLLNKLIEQGWDENKINIYVTERYIHVNLDFKESVEESDEEYIEIDK